MSDENFEGLEGETGAQLRVLTQYIKDLSFENPNAPRTVGPLPEQPQIAVRVDVGAQRLGETEFEVTISLGAEAKIQNELMFLIELDYCGLFRLVNIPGEQIEPVLLIECPRMLFPFARRIIADVTRDGGFPPLLIDPVDFVGLYQQRRAEGQAPN